MVHSAFPVDYKRSAVPLLGVRAAESYLMTKANRSMVYSVSRELTILPKAWSFDRTNTRASF